MFFASRCQTGAPEKASFRCGDYRPDFVEATLSQSKSFMSLHFQRTNNAPNNAAALNPVEWTPQLLLSSDTDEEQRIFIRAVNYDNNREVEQLVELFALHYGGSYPYRSVYSPDFWQQHSPQGQLSQGFNDVVDLEQSRSLTSIVAVHGARFIAHLAVRSDLASGCSEVVFVALHPDFKKQIFRLGELFWEFMLEQARRQSWKLIFHYNLLSNPRAQVVASRCFHATEMALIPNLVSHARLKSGESAPRHERFSLLAMYHQLQPLPETVTIYPPERHLRIIGELYKPLKLQRRIGGPRPAAHTGNCTDCCESTSVLHGSHQEQLGLYELDIEPSTVLCIAQVLDDLDSLAKTIERENRRLCVRVALDDPDCPSFCAALEKSGFRFCGILPIIDHHDRVIYTRFDPAELSVLQLVTERARALRDYMVR